VTPPAFEVDVGDHHDTALEQDLLGVERRGAVGALRDDAGPDARRVLDGDLALEGGRDEDVALELEALGRGQVPRPREPADRSILEEVRLHCLDVETALAMDGPVALRNRDDDRPSFLAELGAVVADVAESLDDDPFPIEAR